LIIANTELAYQNKEKEQRAAELDVANRELVFENLEKEKRATELSLAYNEIKKAEEFLKQYAKGLEDIIFMTNHRVRRPITNILGLANVLDHYLRSPNTLKKITGYMKISALDLDAFTRELTSFIIDLEATGKDH
jgi:signal transduction histidine kinase